MTLIKGKRAQLGMYLGWEGLTIVEQRAKKINNFVYVPYASSPNEQMDITKILSDALKLASLIQKGLRQLKIEGVEIDCAVALMQRDILVRYFSMPVLSMSEMDKALSFEIRKYIPFRLEELQYIFQRFQKGQDKKMDILWLGIKKDSYKQYLSALKQASIKIRALEPAAMSIMRVLANKTNIKKDNIAIIDSSSLESNVTIIHNGIPIFTREVRFSSVLSSEKQEVELIKLGNEFRMAIDFYRRQYALGEVNRIILISDVEISSVFKEISDEMGMPLESYRPKDLIGSDVEGASVETIRAVGASLKNVINIPFQMNLYKKVAKKGVLSYFSRENTTPISKMLIAKIAIVCASTILLTLIFGYTRISRLKKEWSLLKSKQPTASKKYINSSLDILSAEKDKLRSIFNILQEFTEETVFSSEKLSILAKVIPDGVWLDNFSYLRKETKGAELKLSGFAYRGGKKEENKIVDAFALTLKKNSEFTDGFGRVQLDSRSRGRISDYEVEKFSIVCSSR